MHSKIGDILEFANLEAGRYPLTPTVFDVTGIDLCLRQRECRRAFSAAHRPRHGASAAPAEVRADALAVKRIITNLLSNALLYTQEGGGLQVSVCEEVGGVVVAVKDNGNGFSAAEANGVGAAFRRFERAAGVSTGTGLGLRLVTLARRMGGAVRLASAYGEGTCGGIALCRRP